MRLPRAFGLVLCDRMAFDPGTAEVSLVGIFQARRFRNFPSPPQRFTVYTTLYDGVGEGTMEVVVSRLETEEDVGSYKKWFTLPGRGQVVNLALELKRCVFPAPGRYGVLLCFDGKEITDRYLEIFTEE
jgi:hypothetical protein